MSWIQTYTGRQFWPLTPRVEDVCVEDIAHALSLMCRFNGHCRFFYSVAQHSLLVAKLVLRCGMTPDMKWGAIRAALLHDAAESYLADITRPVKHHLSGVQSIEVQLLTCIYQAFEVVVDADLEDKIRYCDDVLLVTEARDLMGPPPALWEPLPEPMQERIVPWSSEVAEKLWLESWTSGSVRV